MRVKYEKWNISGYERDDAVKLCRSGLNPLISVLLASRGIKEPSDIEEIIGTDYMEEPTAFRDMDKAAERVRLAMERHENVVIYGDYDVDGITSSCLLADYLRSKGLDCEIYIPDRIDEGYGVKTPALDRLKERGTGLIITVDCGVTASEEVEYAKKLGMDFVITDHHECCGELPAAVAVVDPKRPDCASRSKQLAGVGVAFKLVCAIEGTEKADELLDRYGDLVAIGTIADVMSVIGENRELIRRGLEQIKDAARPGVRKLCEAAGLKKNRITVSGVGFTLAPRINAAGRLGDTDVALKLLLSENDEEAEKYAEELCRLNTERQQIESVMFAEALQRLEADPPEGRPIVLADENWHQGVMGIVASRIAETFALPTVMISLKDGVGRGSCRSVGDFNIFSALEYCGDLLLGFGGHELAAGLTVAEENIDDFREKLGKYYEKMPADLTAATGLQIDFEVLKPELLSIENVESMKILEPYGTGNPQPVLCMTDVTVENVMPLSGGRHTKMWVSKDGEVFETVFFGRSAEDLSAREGMSADLAFSPQVNEFRGRRSIQLCLVDFREHI